MTLQAARQFLARRLEAIQPSPSIAANALVAKLRTAGQDIVNFTLGEPDCSTPAHIVAAAIEALERGDTHYTPTPGTPALRQAIALKLGRDNKLSYAQGEIVVGSGAKQIIYHAFAATLNEGDEVIVPAPYWVSYPDVARLYGGVPVVVSAPAKGGFKLTPAAIEAAITPRTKWLVLNSPNNPTGAVYGEGELAGIAEVLRRNPDLLVLADEIYEHFVYDGARHVSLAAAAPDLRDRILIVNGVSKGYAMTGWRIGFGAGPEWLVAAICKLLSQSTTCPSSIGQAAAAAALQGDQAPLADMLKSYERRRLLMLSGLQSAPGLRCASPQGAFYVFADVGGALARRSPSGQPVRTEEDFVNYLLQEGGVAVVAGAAYGMSPYIRLSFATSDEAIEEGCRRIAAACAKLN